MASEQMLRRVEFNETVLEIREVHIQKQREGDTNKKKQELHSDRAMSQNKEAERKGREEAIKGLRDRGEKEIRDKMEAEYAKRTMEHTFQEYTARKKEEESEAKRVAQNKESKERPLEKATIKSFEERQEEQDQGGIEKPGAVCKTVGKVSLPQRANQSNTMESFQGVQERDKAKKQGVFGETKIHDAEKMSKTDESLQSQKGGRRNNVYASYADAVKANDCTKRVQEQDPNENIAEKSFEGEKEQPQGGVEHMVKEPLHNKVTDGGSTVLGAVGETVVEIGENMMKPAEKVREKSEEGKGGGVLGAIGETVAEIAQTTKVLALGEGESESKQSIG